MRLKQLRETAGLSQRNFAAIMGVSQPTVTRWETGHAEMSAQRLQEAARALSCTPDDLLGIRRSNPAHIVPHADWDADEACWGTLRLSVGNKAFDFPISFSQRSRITDASLAFDQETAWLEVHTLNNAILLLNLDQLDGIDLITDDEEEPPFHMNSRAYAAVTAGSDEIAEELVEDVEGFRRAHPKAEQQSVLHAVHIHYGSGREVKAPLDTDTVEAICTLLMDPDQSRFFEVPNTNGNIAHVVSLGRVAFIRASFAKLAAQGTG